MIDEYNYDTFVNPEKTFRYRFLILWFGYLKYVLLVAMISDHIWKVADMRYYSLDLFSALICKLRTNIAVEGL